MTYELMVILVGLAGILAIGVVTDASHILRVIVMYACAYMFGHD